MRQAAVLLIGASLLAVSTAESETSLEKRRLCSTKNEAVERLDYIQQQLALGREDLDLQICQPGSDRYALIRVQRTDGVVRLLGNLYGCVRLLTLRERSTGIISHWFVTETCYTS